MHRSIPAHIVLVIFNVAVSTWGFWPAVGTIGLIVLGAFLKAVADELATRTMMCKLRKCKGNNHGDAPETMGTPLRTMKLEDAPEDSENKLEDAPEDSENKPSTDDMVAAMNKEVEHALTGKVDDVDYSQEVANRETSKYRVVPTRTTTFGSMADSITAARKKAVKRHLAKNNMEFSKSRGFDEPEVAAVEPEVAAVEPEVADDDEHMDKPDIRE